MRSRTLPGLGLTLIVLGGCSAPPAATPEPPAPAVVEPVDGTDLNRITLTARAAERLGIRTEPVTATPDRRLAVPYAAVLYDADGATWAYVEGAALVFQRHAIVVDEVDAASDVAFLASGPPAGSSVVTVGVAELFGTESDIGH